MKKQKIIRFLIGTALMGQTFSPVAVFAQEAPQIPSEAQIDIKGDIDVNQPGVQNGGATGLTGPAVFSLGNVDPLWVVVPLVLLALVLLLAARRSDVTRTDERIMMVGSKGGRARRVQRDEEYLEDQEF